MTTAVALWAASDQTDLFRLPAPRATDGRVGQEANAPMRRPLRGHLHIGLSAARCAMTCIHTSNRLCCVDRTLSLPVSGSPCSPSRSIVLCAWHSPDPMREIGTTLRRFRKRFRRASSRRRLLDSNGRSPPLCHMAEKGREEPTGAPLPGAYQPAPCP